MLDRDDREALLTVAVEWGLKVGLGIVAVLSASLTFGIAWRLFEAARG